MPKKLLSCAVVALLASPLTAGAVLINYGTAEAVTFRTCIAGPTTPCDNITAPAQVVYGGFPGAATSTVDPTVVAGFGEAAGSVSLSGFAGEPTLSAYAISDPGARVNTNSIGVQEYTYVGAAPTVRTWQGILSYDQSSTGTYPAGIGSGVFAALDVFTLPTAFIEVGTTAESNFNALFNVSALPGYVSLAQTVFSDPSLLTIGGAANISVTVTLNPGDTVWVWGLLQTPAVNGGVVDAFHTFVTGWDNTADLIPAVIARVPEPGTICLLALALAGIAASRRVGLRPRRDA